MIWLLIFAAGTYCSCSKKALPEPGIEDKAAAAQTPDKPAQDVIMSSDNMLLTLKDYDECLAVLRFQGIEFSPRALANPRFQRDEIQRCSQIAFMRQFVKKNGLSVLPTDRQKALRTAYEQFGVQSEQALAQKLKIEPEQMNDIIDASLLVSVIQRYLASTLDEKALRERFGQDYRVFSIEMGIFDNTPTQEEADEFLKTDEQAFSVYIGAHPEVLKTQPYAQFVRMAYSAADEEARVSAHKSAEELRAAAAEQGVDKALQTCLAQAETGCTVLNDKDNLFDVEKTDALAWAFKTQAGAVSDVIQTEKTEEIWVLQNTKPPRVRDAKDPQVRRETAVHVMSLLKPAPHVIQSLKTEIEAEKIDFKTIVENHHGQFVDLKDTLFMDLKQRSEFPQGVLKVLSEMKREEIMLFSSPVLADRKMYIFRVLQLNEPSESDFAARKASWIEKTASDPSYGLVDEWIQKVMPRMSSINIRPISEKYGTLQTDGRVRF